MPAAQPTRRWGTAGSQVGGWSHLARPAAPSPEAGLWGPYGRTGLGWKLGHTEPQQSLGYEGLPCLCPSWAWRLGVTQKCPSVWARRGAEDISSHLNTSSWLLPVRGVSPSRRWRGRWALPARQRALASSRSRLMGKKVTVFQSRVSIWVSFVPEGSQ